MCIPYSYRSYTGVSGTGSKTYGAIINDVCYADGSIKVVVNDEGVEVVSNKQLYVSGTTGIKVLDKVTFEGLTSVVKAVGTYYGTNGIAELKVVYM